MKYDYFVSGRWRNRDNVLALVNKLRERGRAVYCFLESDYNVERVQTDPEEAMRQFEATPDWRHDAFVRTVFERDMAGLRDSERLVMLLPAGRSCHIEAGAAYGMGKECILIGDQPEAESLYLVFARAYPDVDSFIADLD
jgi:hypothetical protein